jgi:hypothetical protein
MSHLKILAAARAYDVRRVQLEGKETALLRRGTQEAIASNAEAIRRNWESFVAAVDGAIAE